MSQKKNYSRYFIILQEDEKGYGLSSDKVPTGYVKLEVKNNKCKISFYVQSLKSEMKPFSMLLIFNKNNMHKKLIKLGDLNIDDTGKAEFSKDFEADNFAGTNIDIDKISGAAITKLSEGNIICVMKGFTSTDTLEDWKGYELIDLCKRKEQIEPQSSEANKFEDYEAKIEKSKEKAESNNLEQRKAAEELNKAESKECEHNEYIEAAEKIKASEVIRSEEKAEAEKKIKPEEEIKTEERDSAEEEKGDSNDSDEVIKDKIINDEEETLERKTSEKAGKKAFDMFSDLTEDLYEWDDEFEEIAGSRWFYVPVRSLEDMYKTMNYNKFTVIYYPMVNYYPYIIKNGHYMIGYKYDKAGRIKYIVYAIPGTKAIYDQPFGGKYGFVSWTQPKHDKGKNGDMGYWLMFYDFRKSVVVIPSDK